MRTKSLFDFDEYRDYLFSELGQPGRRTGRRMKACRAMGCNTTYLSQVLNGRANLSLEHADSLSRFLQHSEDESDYFLTLLLQQRAGTKRLRERFKKKLAEIRSRRDEIRRRLENPIELTENDRSRFYGSWIYTAIHVLVSIPAFKRADSLAEALGLSAASIKEAVEFLLRIGVILEASGKLSPGPRILHLSADSHYIQKHHTNWRFHAVQSLAKNTPGDIHYSAAVSLNAEVAQKVRENILRALEENAALIGSAAEEQAYVYAFDFYRLA